jgi:hypothetical protein
MLLLLHSITYRRFRTKVITLFALNISLAIKIQAIANPVRPNPA